MNMLTKLQKVILTLFVFFSILCIIYIFCGELFFPSEGLNDSFRCAPFDATWYRVMEDHSREKISIPVTFDVKRNIPVTIETTIPSYITDKDCIALQSCRQNITFLVDGKEVMHFTGEKSRIHGKTSPAAYIFLPLHESYRNKTLTMISVTDCSYNGMISPIFYGNRSGIWKHIIGMHAFEITMAIILIAAGIACGCAGLYAFKFKMHNLLLVHVGASTVLAAIWLFFNAPIKQLLFPNLSVVSDVPFLALILLPIPISFYLDTLQNNRYQKIYCFIEVYCLMNFMVSGIMFFTDTLEYRECFRFTIVAYVLLIVTSLTTIFIDFKNKDLMNYKVPAFGLLMGYIFGVIQLILYLIQVTTFNGTMMCIALLFIIVTTIIDGIHEYGRKEIDKTNAIHSAQAKSQFLANMSHEIRTPINAILGMDEMILRESTESNIQDYAKDLQRAGQSLLSLINDILDYSKIESNKIELVNVNYELSSLINDSYNMVYMRAKDKNLSLEIDTEKDLPSALYGDEVRIRQILLNLLSNGVKYTPAGKVTLRIFGEKQSDTTFLLKISVKDTGKGIKMDDIPHLFDSFNRVEDSSNHHIEGTGLGLSITKQLVELMGGSITVESEYGVGSNFTVEIPQTIVSTGTLNSLKLHYNRSGSEQGTKDKFVAPQAKILVVDDVLVNLKVVSGLLKETKIQVDTATSGLQCIIKCEEQTYDMIFLDHMMPNMDGIETLAKMQASSKNKNKDTPVIMLTANALAGAKEEYLKLGFTNYLSKPILGAALEEMILNYLPDEKVIKSSSKEYEDEQTTYFINQLQQIIDVSAGLEFCNNDVVFFHELLPAFMDPQMIVKLDELKHEKDRDNYTILITTLYNNAKNIGATALAAELNNIINALSTDDLVYIQDHHTQAMRLYANLIEDLSTVLTLPHPGIQ
ncbi:MAG: response regulator [Lachnospiraceae bacterium]|nr:response regulator [Lachnospiraceae bacterium]